MTTTHAPAPPVGRLGFARHEDVDLFVERLDAFERGELSADDWRSFRLLNGVYGQRQDGGNIPVIARKNHRFRRKGTLGGIE